jgi:metallo-beta-lactamase class B
MTGAQVDGHGGGRSGLQEPRRTAGPSIDKILRRRRSLGGTTLVAHLTPGHTRGCTTWTLKVQDGAKSLDVVIIGSLGVNPGFKLVNNADVPNIADEFRRSFKVMRSLPCDVPLASHPAMYNLADKFAKLGKGGANPFIDPAGYKAELDLVAAMFRPLWQRSGWQGPQVESWKS